MPQEEGLIFYKNVSIREFNARFDQTKDLDAKFYFCYNYLLSYGLGDEEPTCSFGELLHTVKTRFSEAVIENKESYEKEADTEVSKYDINPRGVEEDKQKEATFLAQPISFIQTMSNYLTYDYEIDEDDPNAEKVAAWKANCERIRNEIDGTERAFEQYDKNCDALDVTSRVFRKRLGRVDGNLNELFKPNKGGFFERAFNTTSREYREFKSTFEAFNDPESAEYGNKDNLERVTRAYLHHVVPSFGPDDELPSAEDIARLSGAQKGRAGLCLDVLKSVQMQRKVDDLKEHFFEIGKDDSIMEDEEQSQFENDIANDINENYLENDIEKDEINSDNNQIINEEEKIEINNE